MPSRKVAKRGALMKAKINCRKSMTLLNTLATYAVRILSKTPMTVVH
jgi:hypothetical protein